MGREVAGSANKQQGRRKKVKIKRKVVPSGHDDQGGSDGSTNRGPRSSMAMLRQASFMVRERVLPAGTKRKRRRRHHGKQQQDSANEDRAAARASEAAAAGSSSTDHARRALRAGADGVVRPDPRFLYPDAPGADAPGQGGRGHGDGGDADDSDRDDSEPQRPGDSDGGGAKPMQSEKSGDRNFCYDVTHCEMDTLDWAILLFALGSLTVLSVGIAFVVRHHVYHIDGAEKQVTTGYVLLSLFFFFASLLYYVDRNGGYWS